MAPKSKTRRHRGGGFFSRSVKAPVAQRFGEKYAPFRGLASYSAQKRIIGRNVAGLQGKLGQAQNLVNAAKAKNAAYNSLDKEYKEAVADQNAKYNAYTAARQKVNSLLIKRQYASKGVMDRLKGVFKHGIMAIGTRKSYAQNVQANLDKAAKQKAALLERSRVVQKQIDEETRKRKEFEDAIKKQNEEADRVLGQVENAVDRAANAAPAPPNAAPRTAAARSAAPRSAAPRTAAAKSAVRGRTARRRGVVRF